MTPSAYLILFVLVSYFALGELALALLDWKWPHVAGLREPAAPARAMRVLWPVVVVVTLAMVAGDALEKRIHRYR